jgi:H+-transporting ATPase
MLLIKGLTSIQARNALKQYGSNTLPENKKSFVKKIISWLFSPVSLMLLAAAGLSFAVGKQVDFVIILVLFFSNFLISVWHERKADKSIEKLQEHLVIKVKVLRDTHWSYIDSRNIVPGDVVELKIGTIVPADAEILEENNLSVNESALTGESLPVEKTKDDKVFAGSFIATGQVTARVIATGAHTRFGKTITLVDKTKKKSSLEKDILSVSRFISIVSIVVVALLTGVLVYAKAPIADIATLDLSLLIAGIPVALPTVMSLIIGVGVLQLSKKRVIVRRLASLEDLANVDLLLSDKTGTLTENKINIGKIVRFGKYSELDILTFAQSAISDPENNSIDRAVQERADSAGASSYAQESFIPGDSERKRATAVINIGGNRAVVSLGASQVVAPLCKFLDGDEEKFNRAVQDAAREGFRVLALAINKHQTAESDMDIVGLLLLTDTVRADAKDTIGFMSEQGINIKMLTGDSFEISERVAHEIGLDGEVYRRKDWASDSTFFNSHFKDAGAFSELLPKDKFDIVQYAQKQYTVAVTGDGVNDLPAIKTADVGFAVSNAVDALKSSADIVLLTNGISVIKEAIIEARKIFARLYNYSLYRISESFRIIITIAVIGFIYKTYPLTPVQLIVLAFLNDAPIISLAFDKVKSTARPAHTDARKRFTLSSLFGIVGVANSLIFFFLMKDGIHLPWGQIQTMFFLKLTVSGHLLVYVAHTRERWFRFLPSWQVISATLFTQLVATGLALFGIFTTAIPVRYVLFVWIWSFAWVQVGELAKVFQVWMFKDVRV